MDSFKEHIYFIISIAGMLVGYGMLRQQVKDTRLDLNESIKVADARFQLIEAKVSETEKSLSSIAKGVEVLEERSDRIESKIDRLLIIKGRDN